MVKKLLTLGALATLLSLQAYAEVEGCMEKKPEINKIFEYKGTWYIQYTDILSGTVVGYEDVKINEGIDRTVVAGSHNETGARTFPLLSTYDPSVCNEAIINLRDDDNNTLLTSRVYRFGNVADCVVPKPEINQIFNYKGTWYIKYTDTKTGQVIGREDLVIDGAVDRTVVAGSHDLLLGARSYSFGKDTSYSTETCHSAKIVTRDLDGNEILTSDIFYFGDTSTCTCDGTED